MFSETRANSQAFRKATSRQYVQSLFIALMFALTLYPGKAQAQIIGDLEADIPFQFHAGNAKLPAGTYRIHMLDDSDLSVMEITSVDGKASAIFQVQESDSRPGPAQSELIFNKYGDRYFLTKLFDEGNPSGSKVVESRYEKQISKAGAVVAQEHVPAHHRTQRGN